MKLEKMKELAEFYRPENHSVSSNSHLKCLQTEADLEYKEKLLELEEKKVQSLNQIADQLDLIRHELSSINDRLLCQ